MSWESFKKHYLELAELGFALDVSRMELTESYIKSMRDAFEQAFSDMEKLEGGAIANPDENRMVGHYWLRAPEKAPQYALSEAIEEAQERIREIAAQVHGGQLKGAGGKFTDLLVIGIGGSALGPQFVAEALGDPRSDALEVHFFDNTDPDGMDRVLSVLSERLSTTLAIVISKSGGTPETRNGMLEAQAAFKAAGLDFGKQAIAVTGDGSALDRRAEEEGWLARFPMWDWVGGRTSETGPVGILPAALQGLDTDALLKGAAQMDEATRVQDMEKNPAALLALSWYAATNGKGEKDMVILPYKDRLMLFSKYLQQLVMESLGKEKDLSGVTVNQGIAVYGNKGSTDQHAYVQQLREGVNNFFVTFIEVLRDRNGASVAVEEGITSGDYLQGFHLGTREALSENGRTSITITVNSVTPETVGMLIALYERAVGLYASLVNINAYHQPGVEAGKKAAAGILGLKGKIQKHLADNTGESYTADALAEALGVRDQAETIYKLLEHLAANPEKGVQKTPAETSWEATFQKKG